MAKPIRRGKTDRLLSPDATKQEARCDTAVAPFDRMARDMDRKWGIDRLPELVPPEMASKYGAAVNALNKALQDCDVDAVIAHTENCIRGMRAMDAAAEKAGAQKASPEILEYDLDGFKFGILPGDGMDWPAVKAQRPDLILFTLREVAVALKERRFDHNLVAEAKRQFPGAEITAVRARAPDGFDWNHGDDLPPIN